jgi:hypothetical protein
MAKGRLLIFLDMILCLFLFGADSSDYLVFEFFKMNFRARNTFITRIRNKKMRLWTSNEAFGLFDDKGLFNEKYSGFIKRGWLSTRNKTSQEITDFIERYKTVIVKPAKGTWGIGIYRLNSDNKEMVESLVQDVKQGREFLLEENVENIDSIRMFNPPSLNTLRVVTCVDRWGKVHIIKSLIRMGVTDSCVDNARSGGIACSINSEYGIIDSAGKTMTGDSYVVHPVSKIRLLGFAIPYWDELQKYVDELARVEPKARYAGWDIAITRDGFELIEGNMSPGEQVTEMCDLVGKWNYLKSLA